MKKRIAAVVLAATMLLTGCGSKSGASGDTAFTISKDNKKVAEVSAEYAWVDALYMKDVYESFFGTEFWEETDEDGNTNAEYFKEELANDLKMRKIVALEAEKAGITLSDEEKDICQENAEANFETITAETKELTGITVDTLAEYERDYAIYEKYETSLAADADITIDEEALRQSDLFVLTFETVEYNDDGEAEEFDADKKVEVKKKADAAYKLLQDGKTMEQVAETNGMDPEECMWVMGKTAEEDQDDYYDEAFEKAAFALKEGEYSKVVEGLDGYYIIQMTSLNNEEQTEAAIESAQEDAVSALFEETIEKLMDGYDVTTNDSIWSKIDFTADIAFEEAEEYYEEDTSVELETEDLEDSEVEIETEG